MSSRAFLVLSVLLALFAGAEAHGDETPWSQVFEETTEVRVVNFDVFVETKDGEPVPGLGQEDFELLVDGEPVEISNFYAVEGGEVLNLPDATAAEEAKGDLLLVFYIDNANIDPNSRKRIFHRLREFLLANWRPELRVMLATNERTVMIRQDVTEVPHLAFVALEEIESTLPTGQQLHVERQQIVRGIQDINVDAASGFFELKGGDGDESGQLEEESAINEAMALVPQIRAYSQQRLDSTLESLGVLRGFVDTVGGLPGRKALVYVGDELTLRPGASLFEFLARRVEDVPNISTRINSLFESYRFDATSELEKLVSHANASGVVINVLDATPPSVLGREAAIANNATYTASIGSLEESTRRESKERMVQGTGGRANFGSNDFNSVLVGMIQDFDNRYSLGYSADAAPLAEGGEDQKVEIRVKGDRKLRVRHRSSYRQRSLDEEMSQRVLSALILDSFDNPIGVGLQAREQVARDDGNFEVPLLVTVPLGKLVLLPEGKVHRARVSLYVAVRDGQGRSSRVVKHQCPIRIPNKEMLTALGQNAACGMRLAMRGGLHTVAVVVRDDVAGVESTLRAQVHVQLVASGAPAEEDVVEGSR